MFKNLIQKVLDFFISGSNRSVIAICFLMSLLFWFLIKFSKEYTYYVDYPIELNGFSILEIDPDTLFLNFSNKTKKSVQVKVPQNLNFRENYEQYGSFKISPNTVDVFGPSHILDTLYFVYTNVLNQNDIVQSINSTLKIQLPNKLLSTKDSEINVIQEVARFTQISKRIPIKLKNVPKGKELRIKPAEVELSYWVAMKDVDKINASDFVIYCDYNEVDMTDNAILNVFIDESKTPSIVQKVKYHPSTVEFIKLN